MIKLVPFHLSTRSSLIYKSNKKFERSWIQESENPALCCVRKQWEIPDDTSPSVLVSEEEAVSFIDLPLSGGGGAGGGPHAKVPEKGILKKACPYDLKVDHWNESPQSETQSQCENPVTGAVGGGETISEVERTLRSLDGYHENIREAIRNATVTHCRAGPSSSTGIIFLSYKTM